MLARAAHRPPDAGSSVYSGLAGKRREGWRADGLMQASAGMHANSKLGSERAVSKTSGPSTREPLELSARDLAGVARARWRWHRPGPALAKRTADERGRVSDRETCSDVAAQPVASPGEHQSRQLLTTPGSAGLPKTRKAEKYSTRALPG